jgi:hypothetical protein
MEVHVVYSLYEIKDLVKYRLIVKSPDGEELFSQDIAIPEKLRLQAYDEILKTMGSYEHSRSR